MKPEKRPRRRNITRNDRLRALSGTEHGSGLQSKTWTAPLPLRSSGLVIESAHLIERVFFMLMSVSIRRSSSEAATTKVLLAIIIAQHLNNIVTRIRLRRFAFIRGNLGSHPRVAFASSQASWRWLSLCLVFEACPFSSVTTVRTLHWRRIRVGKKTHLLAFATLV